MIDFEINKINASVTHLAKIVENEAYSDYFQDVCKMAIKGLEKQIPKKPKFVEPNYGYFECDSCGEAIYYDDVAESHKYCLHCGQALDWGQEE